MKKTVSILGLPLLIISLFLISSCKKKPSPPIVTTRDVTEISYITATSGGDVIDNGGDPVLTRGVCWDTSADPTSENNFTHNSEGTGKFISNITHLIPNTLYYVRAYAKNNAGTGYGEQISFTTLKVAVPVLTTKEITAITQTTAVSGGNITDDNGGYVIARGVCWSITANPTIELTTKTINGAGKGEFTSLLTGLIVSTTYFVRTYSTNSAGTSYGNEISFTTNQATAPTLTTVAASSITQTSATSGGNVTSNGEAPILARGVCWNTSSIVSTANSKTTDVTGVGSYTSLLTGLAPGTTYFVKSYAINSVGTSYGNEISFLTRPVTLPVLTTTEASFITQTTATCGGTITSDGGAPILIRGVRISLSANFNSVVKITDGTGTGSFTSQLDGLMPGTTYYVQAYATNIFSTEYGNEISFTTSDTTPTLSTTTVSSITQTTAASGGNVTKDGGASVIFRGVCWNTSANPTITDFTKTTSGETGSFTSSITGLIPYTTYYLRAYATNNVGTGYGNAVSFTTLWYGIIFNPDLTYGTINNAYKTITIGTQTWMAENLRATIYQNGALIGTTTPATLDITGESTPKYQWAYGGNENNVVTYGRLYSWYAATDSRNICPNGYHLPSNGEWIILATYLGGSIVTGGKLKETGTTHWYFPNEGATNESGFTALPGGDRLSDGTFSGINNDGHWWSSTEDGPNYAMSRYMVGGSSIISSISPEAQDGYSVRCLMNSIPTVTTTAASSITSATATCGGDVTIDGGSKVTYRGVCWSTSANPTPSNKYTSTRDGSGMGIFTSSITGLKGGTTYYVRAWAINDISGIAYGNEISFTTSPAILPTITTKAISFLTPTSADSGGNVSSDGGETVTARGVCWSTSANPTISNSKTTNGAGSGSFASSLTALTASTTYYVRAWANNVLGTAYGNEISFTTSPASLPTITTIAVHFLTPTIVDSGGNISNDGGSTVTERGVCWSTAANPTIADSKTTNGAGSGTFSSRLSALTGTTYYIRAYATNGLGTVYGNEISFTTSQPTIPTLTTTAISTLTQTSAISGGHLLYDGGTILTAVGVCWRTSANPTITDSKTINNIVSGLFASSLTALTAGTTYYVRAYATNSLGTAYGNEISFTTNP